MQFDVDRARISLSASASIGDDFGHRQVVAADAAQPANHTLHCAATFAADCHPIIRGSPHLDESQQDQNFISFAANCKGPALSPIIGFGGSGNGAAGEGLILATDANGTMLINPEHTNFTSMGGQLWYVKSWQEVLFRALLVLPILLLGIMGNLTIIYSMCKFKRFRQKPTNIFILNMAIADLLTTVVCTNAALLNDIYQFYMLGAFICRTEGFIKITCLLVGAYSLIVLSFDWLLCVVRPCRMRISIRQSWLTLAVIWLVSVMMASPLIRWRTLRERQWLDVLEVWCNEDIERSKSYWFGITFFLIYLPTFIMTVVLVVILLRMDKFEAKLRRSRQANWAKGDTTRRLAATGSRLSLELHEPTTSQFNGSRQQTRESAFISHVAHQQQQQHHHQQQLQHSSENCAQEAHSSVITICGATQTSASSSNYQTSQSDPNGSLSIHIKYRRRIVKILFAYLLTSIVCWTPLQFSIVYRFNRQEPVMPCWLCELSFYSQLFASLSGAMNPIIFGFLSQPFKMIVTKSWVFRFFSKFFISNRGTRHGARKPAPLGVGRQNAQAQQLGMNQRAVVLNCNQGASPRKENGAASRATAAAVREQQHHHQHHLQLPGNNLIWRRSRLDCDARTATRDSDTAPRLTLEYVEHNILQQQPTGTASIDLMEPPTPTAVSKQAAGGAGAEQPWCSNQEQCITTGAAEANYPRGPSIISNISRKLNSDTTPGGSCLMSTNNTHRGYDNADSCQQNYAQYSRKHYDTKMRKRIGESETPHSSPTPRLQQSNSAAGKPGDGVNGDDDSERRLKKARVSDRNNKRVSFNTGSELAQLKHEIQQARLSWNSGSSRPAMPSSQKEGQDNLAYQEDNV